MADRIVRAAGGIVWRRATNGSVELLLVHRPGVGYDDWTFPKGKRDAVDDTEEDCALREVYEETGYRCVLGHEIARTAYIDRKGREKKVRYWTMTVDGGAAELSMEVDEIRWVPLTKVPAMLTYERDAAVVDSFLSFLKSGLAR
jgi:8-oxo-dGTP pyrophosphatase MutT (NUDIX family)